MNKLIAKFVCSSLFPLGWISRWKDKNLWFLLFYQIALTHVFSVPLLGMIIMFRIIFKNLKHEKFIG